MGETIEFERYALKVPEKKQPNSINHSPNIDQQVYILCAKIGSSNSFNHDGTIAKSWSYFDCGTESEVMTELARCASDIESGMLRYQNGKTKIERYLTNWRNEITDDVVTSVQKFTEKFPLSEVVIVDPEKPKYSDKLISEVLSYLDTNWRRTQPSPETYEYRHNVNQESLWVMSVVRNIASVRLDLTKNTEI